MNKLQKLRAWAHAQPHDNGADVVKVVDFLEGRIPSLGGETFDHATDMVAGHYNSADEDMLAMLAAAFSEFITEGTVS